MGGRVEIGRVAEIHRYPVKSMRGQTVAGVDVRWNGLDGDRQYAFLKTADMSRFPWATGRIFAGMILWQARYEDDARPKASRVHVTMDDNSVHEVTAPELTARLSAEAGADVGLIRLARGTFDSMPVSLVGRQTLDNLADKSEGAVEALRFRPNIVIDRGLERDWIGGRLVFEDSPLRLRVDRPIERCSMITIDPATADRNAKLMRTVVEDFNNEIGVYCTPEVPGTLVAGAKVWLQPA